MMNQLGKNDRKNERKEERRDDDAQFHLINHSSQNYLMPVWKGMLLRNKLGLCLELRDMVYICAV